MSHTKGKLEICGFYAVNERGRAVFDCSPVPMEDEEIKANARRLVACWSACDGVSTDGLERFPLSVRGVIDIGILKQERDALKAELSKLSEYRDKYLAVLEEIAALKAENERLRKDAERLNAIERGGIELRMQYEREEEDLFLVFKINGFPNDLEYFEIGRGVTVREAIDAATKEAK